MGSACCSPRKWAATELTTVEFSACRRLQSNSLNIKLVLTRRKANAAMPWAQGVVCSNHTAPTNRIKRILLARVGSVDCILGLRVQTTIYERFAKWLWRVSGQWLSATTRTKRDGRSVASLRIASLRDVSRVEGSIKKIYSQGSPFDVSKWSCCPDPDRLVALGTE